VNFDQEFLDGTSPRIYPWNQSQMLLEKFAGTEIAPSNFPQNRKSSSPALIRGVNRKLRSIASEAWQPLKSKID
jgi:hypothetical protein